MAIAMRAPAGAIFKGQRIGGQAMSSEMARQTHVGGATLVSRFPSIIANLSLRTGIANEETAEEIAADARAAAPRDTGALQASIHPEELPLSGDWAVVADVDYAVYVEFGRTGMAAQPYMVPAVDENRDTHVANTVQVLQEL